jgi:Phasin protein
MSADFLDTFRQVLKLNIEQSRRAFETLMATRERVWVTRAVWPLGDKIIKSFRDNAAAHFAFALRLIASKDPNDALRLYAEHVEERMQTLSRQFQEISSFAGQIGAANKSDQFGDISCANKAANKTDLPGIPTVPAALRTHKATPQSSHQGANGLLNSEVASVSSSNQPRVAKRGGKSKKPRNLQKAAARPAAGKAASKQRKRRT